MSLCFSWQCFQMISVSVHFVSVWFGPSRSVREEVKRLNWDSPSDGGLPADFAFCSSLLASSASGKLRDQTVAVCRFSPRIQWEPAAWRRAQEWIWIQKLPKMLGRTSTLPGDQIEFLLPVAAFNAPNVSAFMFLLELQNCFHF